MLDVIMNEIASYGTQLVLAGLCAFCAWIWRVVVAICNGVNALLRRAIIEDCVCYLDKGWVPIEKKDPLEKCYKAYTALGGNGTVTKIYADVNELPNIPPNEIERK